MSQPVKPLSQLLRELAELQQQKIGAAEQVGELLRIAAEAAESQEREIASLHEFMQNIERDLKT